MSYLKHNFQSGDKLYAHQLNEMDDQIIINEASSLKKTAQHLSEAEKAQILVNLGINSSGESLENVVRYDAEQSLTDVQKNIARNNIGAADKDEVSQLKSDTINSLNELDQKISDLEFENTGDSEGGSSANLAFNPIVCWGDSLTYGYSDPLDNNNFDGYSKSRFDHRQRICYPSALAEMVGRPVINLGVSGETCQTIMARQGADPMLTPAFTIPADTTPVEIGTFGNLYNGGLKTKSGRNATILGYGNSGINPCYIKGIKGYLTATGQKSDRSGIKYYFQRETAGAVVSVPEGTVIQTYAMRNLRKGVAIIWMGYNGQFNGPQDMVNKINSMIEYGHYSDYLVLTCNEIYADDSYGFYKAAWGNRFLYLRPLLGRIGVQEAGLWSDGTLKDNGIAQELDYDGVHFNSYGCKAIASFVFKRLLENGSLSKIEEPEEEPDDPNIPDEENPEEPPVSNPIIDHLDLDGTYNDKHYVLKSNEEFTLGRDSYYVTDFAPYGTDLATNDFTMCMEFTGTPSDEMALYTANYNKSYGDQRGISAIWDGSTVSFVLGNNTFNLTSGGCVINSDDKNVVILRKQGTTFGVYCNGKWMHGNPSIGSNVSGATHLANLKLLLGANRSSGNKDNIVQGTGTLVVSNMILYDSALSNNEIIEYQFPA